MHFAALLGDSQGIRFSFDGTKVPQLLQVASECKDIVRGCVSSHFINISNETEAEEAIKAILNKNTNVVVAKEIKDVLVAIQAPCQKKSALFVLADQPQSVNMKLDLNKNFP